MIVWPDENIAIVFEADNTGQWMFHCLNTFRLEAGMAALRFYVR